MKKAKRQARFLTALVTSVTAASLVFAAAATGGEMKSDPENYYLDPEEIRPIVRDDVEGTVMLWKRAQGPKGVYGKIKKFDVRLLYGQIPLYTIDGEVAAYIYIAYVVPGPLPTIDEIITKAKEISGARDDFMRNKERTGTSLREFYSEHFPYGNNWVFALYGVNEHCTSGIKKQGLPKIIYSLKKAEDAARDYYGSGDFEYVGFVFCSKKQGYEFTDGRRNIIVPTYWRSGIIYPEDIVTRDEVEANIDDYRVPVDWDRFDKWVERWKRKLSGLGSKADSKIDNEIPDYGLYSKGPWCYLHQTYYDDGNKLWENGWYYYEDSPILENRGGSPRQYSLFGTCAPIACASVLAYYEADNFHLIKNDWEWEKVRGFESGEYYYPEMRLIECEYKDCKYSDGVCNYAAYMCLLVGAIYQNYNYLGKDFSFFDRAQGTQNGGNMYFDGCYDALVEAIEDFNAEVFYNAEHINYVPDPAMCVERIDSYRPFVLKHKDSPVDHGVAVYGYHGWDPSNYTLDELGFFDWRDDDWPASVQCEYDFYPGEFANRCIYVNDRLRRVTASYVKNVEVKTREKRSKVSWTNTAVTELDVLGYNVVERVGSGNPLNEVMIRPTARFGGGKYKFKLPPGWDAGKVAIQAVLKNGKTVDYPVLVDVREAQE